MNFRLTTFLTLITILPAFSAYHSLEIQNNTGFTLTFSDGHTINDQSNLNLTVGDDVAVSFKTSEKGAEFINANYEIKGSYKGALQLLKDKQKIDSLDKSDTTITLGKAKDKDIVFVS